MSWNWDHLRFFLALARTGSLKAAGEREGVSHSTVLRRLRSFEGELGTQLFDHSPDGWTLTSTGRQVLLQAERMEQSMRAIVDDVGGADRKAAGPVTLAVGQSVALTVLPEILSSLAARQPELEIAVLVSQSLADVARREADIALRFTNDPPPSLVGRRLGRSALVPCASPAYVKAHGSAYPDDAEGHRFIVVPSHPPPTWSALRLDRHPARVLRVSCFVTAGELCRADLGIAELPDFLVRRDRGLVRLEAPPRPSATAWLLLHPELRDVARIRVTADALFDALGQEFRSRE